MSKENTPNHQNTTFFLTSIDRIEKLLTFGYLLITHQKFSGRANEKIKVGSAAE
jgi:hypothetical protein